MRITRVLLAASLAVLPLATTCGTATDDRTGPSGTQPDNFADATKVTVYRNANDVPNVATFCLGQFGWASTLSGTDAAENKTAVLVRFPELDKTCP